MLADHICRSLFSETAASVIIRQTIGRIAFPLFAYMLVQGFFRTGSRKKYGLSLLIAAIISEPAFDLAFHGQLVYWKDQNVILTLLFSLIMLSLVERFKEKPVISIIIAAAFAFFAESAYFDYGAAGILVCLIFYYSINAKPWLSCLLACIPLLIAYGSIGAFLTVPVLYFSTNSFQKLKKAWKYFFYAFYPAHLFILGAIRYFTLKL